MTRDTYAVLKLKIEKEISKLQKQAKALQAKRRTPVLAAIVRSMREYDITPDEIVAALNNNKKGVKPPKAAPRHAATAVPGPKRTVPAKYRHPETGNTWTGRGKPPRWVVSAEAEGKKRDDFLIAPKTS